MSEIKNASTLACGCCETTATEQTSHENRSGQAVVQYRLGTHGSILQRMLKRLAKQEILSGEHEGQRPLTRLTTRANDDASIAMLDAWAATADVLGFYQERIANEGFLRTATERRSVLELARAIGYELNPGVAASTYLAFSVDDSDSTPDTALIKAGTQVLSIPSKEDELPQTFETSEEFEAHVKWNKLTPQLTTHHTIRSGTTTLYLQGLNLQLKAGDAILIVGDERIGESGNENWDVRILKTVEEFVDDRYTKVSWEKGLGAVIYRWVIAPAADATAKVYVFRKRQRLFGHNAPDWRLMPEDVKSGYCNDNPSCINGDEWPGFAINPNLKRHHIDGDYPEILPSTWMALTSDNYTELYYLKEVETSSQTNFGLTAKTTRVTLDTTENLSKFDRRSTIVLTAPEELSIAEKPREDKVRGRTIDLHESVSGLHIGQPLIISGKLDAADSDSVNEVVFFEPSQRSEAYKVLEFKEALQHEYVRSTVSIHANVVYATHGETISEEVCGSGDGSLKNQTFSLHKTPLTFVSASTASGAESTLDVRVDDVLWQQAASLYGKAPTDKNYLLRMDNEARASIIFGDGEQGARLPSGQENIKAAYRFGIGREGEVGANTLTLLKKRPFGIRDVNNPVAASGAADPEKLEYARANAPLTVLTLDRIVSLRDFEDFARAYAGVGKARASSIWNGESYLIHITVADDNGGDLLPGTINKLLSAVDSARDPGVEVSIKNYQSLNFLLKASVSYDSAYLAEKVQTSIEENLLNTFSFNQRHLGQAVTAAEIVTAIHQVEGVSAVDLDALHYAVTSVAATTAQTVLTAEEARWHEGEILPAQLLLLDATGITLSMRLV